jgi:mannose-6-phosphate isomerase-like protein (cupin superfamily)
MTSVLQTTAERPGALASPGAGGTREPARPPGATTPPPWLDALGLVSIARGLARNVDLWPEMARPTRRMWDLMVATEDFEAWVIGWPPGGAIELHDHGPAAGALVVARGDLLETAVRTGEGGLHTDLTVVPSGGSITFGPGHIHDVTNIGTEPAVSVHVYAPRLTAMTTYDIAGGRLEPGRTALYERGRSTCSASDGPA